MELINSTDFPAAYTLGVDPEGRESLVVVVKGTFLIPAGAAEPLRAAEQAPLIMADEFTGEPGHTAPRYESDFAPHKPRCDVLLNGSAHAPGRRPQERIAVELQVAGLRKSFAVVGIRTWTADALGVRASLPEPFTVMAISYDNAFGGVDDAHPDPSKHDAYYENPAGCGFHVQTAPEFVKGKPLPNTEEVRIPVSTPHGKYRPMAFGPLGRAWQPRAQFAGTYDQNWLDNVFPFLPADFDQRYFQAAPTDQQIDYPQGGEEVVLTNLTPAGHTAFDLPRLEMPVAFVARRGARQDARAVVDTLILEPDLNRFVLVWRASLPLKRNIFELAQVVVGEMPLGWWRARQLGKTYYPSLRELVAAHRRERGEEEATEEAL